MCMRYMIAASRGRNPDNPSERAKSNGKYKQMLEINRGGNQYLDWCIERQFGFGDL